MNVIVDENIPLQTVAALRSAGYEVFDIRGTEQEGIDDAQLWDLANELKALLITTDKGFTRYRNNNRFGILVVRLRHPNRERIHQRVIQAIS